MSQLKISPFVDSKSYETSVFHRSQADRALSHAIEHPEDRVQVFSKYIDSGRSAGEGRIEKLEKAIEGSTCSEVEKKDLNSVLDQAKMNSVAYCLDQFLASDTMDLKVMSFKSFLGADGCISADKLEKIGRVITGLRGDDRRDAEVAFVQAVSQLVRFDDATQIIKTIFPFRRSMETLLSAEKRQIAERVYEIDMGQKVLFAIGDRVAQSLLQHPEIHGSFMNLSRENALNGESGKIQLLKDASRGVTIDGAAPTPEILDNMSSETVGIIARFANQQNVAALYTDGEVNLPKLVENDLKGTGVRLAAHNSEEWGASYRVTTQGDRVCIEIESNVAVMPEVLSDLNTHAICKVTMTIDSASDDVRLRFSPLEK